MAKSIGLLLVNLGTPDSPALKDVFRYLSQFLTDPRVIDLPWLKRQLLVRGLIVPSRFRNSAKSYSEIWTKDGSPLLLHSQNLAKALQKSLGSGYDVRLAMRYQNPSIKMTLESMRETGTEKLIILPLFPQYASASTGSVQQEVMKHLSQWLVIPHVHFINNFATHPKFIQAFIENGKRYAIKDYDHVIFSFHGLPQRQIKKADLHGCCLKANCCKNFNRDNQACYAAQCYATARGIINGLDIPEEKATVTFQSRLGKDPWIQPFTSDRLTELAKEKKKKVLLFSPSFVCDCLETLHEISIEYKHAFLQQGGEVLDLVESLNDQPHWVEALKEIVDHCKVHFYL